MPFILNDPIQTIPEIHVGDIGTNFIVTIYKEDSAIFNLSGATSLTIRFFSSARVSKDRVASLYTNGTDGKVVYSLADGDIDVSGGWTYQVIIEIAGNNWNTNIVPFTVYPNIPAPIL